MQLDNFCFVDIETSGTNIIRNRIIEIGIIRVEKGKVKKTYSTLINPEGYIDPYVEMLTGIRHADLESAPVFSDVKNEIFDLLRDSVFVAHNARFDYGFLKNEYRRFGMTFTARQLCTVKLARLLYPGYRKYDLDSIITRHDIRCIHRHRALDDAQAIWEFFQKAKKVTTGDTFFKALHTALKRPSLPSGVSEAELDTLPEAPGVYIFLSDQKIPLYIGKSVNVRDRVLSHFANDHASSCEMKIAQQVKTIKVIETAGELGALFLESRLIKDMMPLYNRKLRVSRKMLMAKKIITGEGYYSVEKYESEKIHPGDTHDLIGIFRSEKQMEDFLSGIAGEYHLCLKLLGLEKTKGYCFRYHLGECFGACRGEEPQAKYNLRFMEAFFRHTIKPWPYRGAIMIKEEENGTEYFIIDKWCYLGSIREEGDKWSVSTEYVFDFDIYKILIRFFSNSRNLAKVRLFSENSGYS